MIKAKVSSLTLLALSLILLVLPTTSTVDPFWNTFDNYVRPNIPDPDLRQALKDAILIHVLPTSKEIEFTYELADGGHAKITLEMTSDGNLKNVRGQLSEKKDQNSVYEYTEEEIAEVVGGLYQQLPVVNLKKIEKSKTLSGFRYELIYQIPAYPWLTYLVDCISNEQGQIEIDRSEYFSLPPLERSLLKSVSEEELEESPQSSNFIEDLFKVYPGLFDSKILDISRSFPYFSVLFSLQEGGKQTEVLLVVEYNYITHEMFEISRQENEIDGFGKQQVEKVIEDAVELVTDIHAETNSHVGKTIVLKEKDVPQVTVYSDEQEVPFVEGTPIPIEQYTENEEGQDLGYVREIIVNENDQIINEIIIDNEGKVVEEITPEENGGFILSENEYEEEGQQNTISVEIQPPLEDTPGFQIGKVIKQTITPIIVTNQDQEVISTQAQEISSVIIDEDEQVSESHIAKVVDSQGAVHVLSETSDLGSLDQEIEETRKPILQKRTIAVGQLNPRVSEAQRPRQTNCLRYNGNHCIRCFNRFYLDENGVCHQVQNECERYNDYTGECYECYHGYILSFGICIEIDPLCAKTDFSGECIKCYKNYHLSEGKCFKDNGNPDQVIPLCKAANRNGECIECEKGAYLVSQECRIIDPHCQIFDYKKKECEICKRGFFPDGENCIRMW